MPHRDPDTGQFVSSHGDSFDDIEVVSFSAGVGTEAANLSGITSFQGETENFEGLELLDYDEIVDRNEELMLLQAQHHLAIYANSTESEDGTVAGTVEVSASPSLSFFNQTPGSGATLNSASGGDMIGTASNDDSIDIIGRPLAAMAGAPFSDTATGVGGAGTQGDDSVELAEVPGEMARFHPRDELFLNGDFDVYNIDDAGFHAIVTGQHIYGVMSE